VRVRHEADGIVRVVLRDVDVPANTITTLDALPLSLLEGENQIVLRLTHDVADPGVIHASFDLLGGAAPRSFSFAPVGHIFGTGTPGDPSDDEVFTRAQIVAIAPSDQQNGTYGTLHVDNEGHWSYALDNSAFAVQQLAQGGRPSTPSGDATDGLGSDANRRSRRGRLSDTPVITSPADLQNGADVVEDGQHQSPRQFTADVDHGATLHWSASRNLVNYSRADDLLISKTQVFHDAFDAGGLPAVGASRQRADHYLINGAFRIDGSAARLTAHEPASRGVGYRNLWPSGDAPSSIDPAPDPWPQE
jgi:hypothetical protein